MTPRERFLSSRVSPKIDLATFEPGVRGTSASMTKRCQGTVKRHEGGFTIHDPSPSDLVVELADQVLAKLEVTLDFRDPYEVEGTSNFPARMLGLQDFIATNLWPYEFSGLHRTYRVSPAQGISFAPPMSVDHDGDAVDPRLPHLGEVLYVGHRDGYARAPADSPNFAQVRMYYKTEDNRQTLPVDRRSIRLEVTIGTGGLRSMGLTVGADLGTFKFRKMLAGAFRFLAAEAVVVPEFKFDRRVACRQSTSLWSSSRFKQQVRSERRALARVRRETAGVVSLHADDKVTINPHAVDAEANAKVGEALDNLTRQFVRCRPRALPIVK